MTAIDALVRTKIVECARFHQRFDLIPKQYTGEPPIAPDPNPGQYGDGIWGRLAPTYFVEGSTFVASDHTVPWAQTPTGAPELEPSGSLAGPDPRSKSVLFSPRTDFNGDGLIDKLWHDSDYEQDPSADGGSHPVRIHCVGKI